MTDCLYRDCPRLLADKLIMQVDLCCQECVWRRRFVRNWIDHGLDFALADWSAGAPKRNPMFLTAIQQTVEEIKTCRSNPFPS